MSAGKATLYTSSPSHGDAKPAVDSQLDTVNGGDSVPGVYANAASGLAAGSTLPHFSQVWSSTAQDTVVYNADQLLAQMTAPAVNGQALLYHGSSTAAADTGVLLTADASPHVQPAIYQCVLSTLCQLVSPLSHIISRTASKYKVKLMNTCYKQEAPLARRAQCVRRA